jgi:protein arginine kinase activator
MICQHCNQRPATIHLTKIINYEKTELHLCEACAQVVGNELGIMIEPNFTFQNLLASLLDGDFNNLYQQASQNTTGLYCQQCGLTLTDFRNNGLLGCSDCYKSFRSNLEPLLKKVHGGTVHVGKVPKRTGGKFRIKKEIEKLRNKLHLAISHEEYEKAAQLRDEIRRLEQEL